MVEMKNETVFETKEKSGLDRSRKLGSKDFRKGMIEESGTKVFSDEEFKVIQASIKNNETISELIVSLKEIGCSEFVIGFIVGEVFSKDER